MKVIKDGVKKTSTGKTKTTVFFPNTLCKYGAKKDNIKQYERLSKIKIEVVEYNHTKISC